MKFIEISIVDVNEETQEITRAQRQLLFEEYLEYRILYKQNILEDIISELNYNLNMEKYGNKKD